MLLAEWKMSSPDSSIEPKVTAIVDGAGKIIGSALPNRTTASQATTTKTGPLTPIIHRRNGLIMLLCCGRRPTFVQDLHKQHLPEIFCEGDEFRVAGIAWA